MPLLCQNAGGVSPLKNLSILVICQWISATGSFVVVLTGGIIGASLTNNPAYATLPVSALILAAAIAALPAANLMRRIGRRAGFACGSWFAVLGMLLATWSFYQQSFLAFAAGAGLLGVNLAFSQQYRYAAAESVPAQYVGRAVSFVLLGPIFAALLGPVIVAAGREWFDGTLFAGTFLALAIMFAVQSVLFLLLNPTRQPVAEANEGRRRSIGELAQQRLFVVAVLVGTTAYATMSLLMTATPLSMHVADHFTIEQTAAVVRGHVLGMYVPSLFSGFLIDRFGHTKVMGVGALALFLSVGIAVWDQSYLHYASALILLGVGWNFMFIGATATLTLTYEESEKFTAQGVNEVCVFGSAALASLLAGTILHFFGWVPLALIPLPFLLLATIGLYSVRRNSLLQARAAESTHSG